MNATQLKNSILQEAIEGRLVPQLCQGAGMEVKEVKKLLQ
jgi:hypothetical protein